MSKKQLNRDLVTISLSPASSILLDLLANARGLNRSETLRYLIVKDAADSMPALLQQAVSESITNKRGVVQENKYGLTETARREELMGAFAAAFECKEGVENYADAVCRMHGITLAQLGELSTEQIEALVADYEARRGAKQNEDN